MSALDREEPQEDQVARVQKLVDALRSIVKRNGKPSCKYNVPVNSESTSFANVNPEELVAAQDTSEALYLTLTEKPTSTDEAKEVMNTLLAEFQTTW